MNRLFPEVFGAFSLVLAGAGAIVVNQVSAKDPNPQGSHRPVESTSQTLWLSRLAAPAIRRGGPIGGGGRSERFRNRESAVTPARASRSSSSR
jgi:hypothetical protein